MALTSALGSTTTQSIFAVQKNDKLVFREIGNRLKLTPSRVKQIETAALKKLNTRLSTIFNIL